MGAAEKSGYVTAAKRIKEDFHIQHPDAKTRCVQRKGKRAKHDHASAGGARSETPPSLQALALVGSRLNQAIHPPPSGPSDFRRCDSASTYSYTQGGGGSSYDAPSRRDYDDDDDDEEYELRDGGESDYEAAAPSAEAPSSTHQPSLLEQLCTVTEAEHAAAAQMLSALGAC